MYLRISVRKKDEEDVKRVKQLVEEERGSFSGLVVTLLCDWLKTQQTAKARENSSTSEINERLVFLGDNFSAYELQTGQIKFEWLLVSGDADYCIRDNIQRGQVLTGVRGTMQPITQAEVDTINKALNTQED